MGNVKYRTDFIFKCLINIGAFIYYMMISRDPILLILIILNTIYVISVGVKIHKEKGWNRVYRKHDQRTKSNTHFAGYLSMWFMLIALIAGGLSMKYDLLPIDIFELISGVFLGGLLIWWFIRDYLNIADVE
ncbi:hypothetical protein [Virgibacillus siamensis]|uniref:hypothetical protein n=1 Tax=Virgibacillus siamensis TaxID=480071 RepID=UPI000984B56D|nr:hypothetical protein [Virgibacillus siamensis]